MWSISRFFRKREVQKYPERFIQGIDYEETRSRWLPFLPQTYRMLQDRTTLTQVLEYEVNHKYFSLNKAGYLTVKKGYSCDGPSGWTIDTPSFMRGAIGVHDPFFQMLREEMFGELTDEEWEDLFQLINRELERICTEDGMVPVRHDMVYYAVQKGGRSSATKKGKK